MDILAALLAGIVAEPLEETRWLVLADYLEENDDPRRAELLRLHRRLLATCCEPEVHLERSEWQARVTELLVAGVVPCVPQHTLSLPGGIKLVCSFVPSGSFWMGSFRGFPEEKPVHKVTLTRDFFLGIHPVTQTQWKAVMGIDHRSFRGPNRPVEGVSWDDCQEFCNKLTARLGNRMTIQLPTEAEWECACRAGTTTEFYFGDVLNTDRANYDGNYSWNGSPKGIHRNEATDVTSFPPNPWGIFDLHDNVWEWCSDRFEGYQANDQTDPQGESDVDHRILRGGGWDNNPLACRAANRRRDSPTRRHYYYGFRVCFHPD